LAARKIQCEIFREGQRFGYRVRFHDAERFHYTSPRYESLERALAAHDGHQKRIWEQPGLSAAALMAYPRSAVSRVSWRESRSVLQSPLVLRTVDCAGTIGSVTKIVGSFAQ
jgi:hypothetical protein